MVPPQGKASLDSTDVAPGQGAGESSVRISLLLQCQLSSRQSSPALEEGGAIPVVSSDCGCPVTHISPFVSGRPGSLQATCCPVYGRHGISSRASTVRRDKGPMSGSWYWRVGAEREDKILRH